MQPVALHRLDGEQPWVCKARAVGASSRWPLQGWACGTVPCRQWPATSAVRSACSSVGGAACKSPAPGSRRWPLLSAAPVRVAAWPLLPARWPGPSSAPGPRGLGVVLSPPQARGLSAGPSCEETWISSVLAVLGMAAESTLRGVSGCEADAWPPPQDSSLLRGAPAGASDFWANLMAAGACWSMSHGCLRAYFTDIRWRGFTCRSRRIKSTASLDRASCQPFSWKSLEKPRRLNKAQSGSLTAGSVFWKSCCAVSR
mmetsp:Transcript_1222/g.3714  ORF Transcript_1222/g.3714 Transcript_1222/m.3714 type:complete len:257 (+) Transcript_1222:428-1198(+)